MLILQCDNDTLVVELEGREVPRVLNLLDVTQIDIRKVFVTIHREGLTDGRISTNIGRLQARADLEKQENLSLFPDQVEEQCDETSAEEQ